MKRLYIFAVIAFLIAAALILSLKFLANRNSRTYSLMGTYITITINDAKASAHMAAAHERLKELEKLLNRFDPKSEVSLINREAANTEVIISPDTYKCIDLAQKVSRTTSGAFDITLTGDYKNIALNPKNHSVRFKKPGIKINLDGIAKGYAVEEARRVLFKRGVKSAMIDAASSIAVLGGPWKIGIKNPRKKDDVLGIIVLQNGEAVSTSGTYEQGPHIIDPKTGKPADSCISVTVVGRDAGFLDGLSTGLFVLGPKDGAALSKKLKLRVIMIARGE